MADQQKSPGFFSELFAPIAYAALALLGLHVLLGATWLRRTP